MPTFLLNPWAILALLGMMAGGFISGELHGRKSAKEHIEALKAHDAELIQSATKESERVTVAAISTIQVQHVTVRQTLEKQIVDRPVYRECRNDDDVLQIINQAITGKTGSPAAQRGELSGDRAADRP